MEIGVEQKEIITESKKMVKKRVYRELISGLLFASPVLLGFLIFVIGPVLYTVYLSFTKYNIVSAPQFVGFDNYIHLLSGKDAFYYPAVKATFYYVMLSVPAGIIFSFFIAILLNMKIRGRTIFRAIFYLPV
ncbi:carbohydrate ABC transporter permease, partial [Paenibacillus aceris]